jgi:hypothetical protein
VLSVLVLLGALTTSGCGSERLLSVQFNDERVGSAPAIDQEVGRCRTGDFGTVRIEHLPGGGGGNWIQLTQAQRLAPPAKLRCSFAAFRGDGRYLVTMRLFIPSGMAAFILFQSGGFDPPNFFSIEFPDSGVLHPPGSTAIAGRFPHDKVFSVAVNFNIGRSSTAEVTLLGQARGSFVTNVAHTITNDEHNFSAIQLTTDVGKAGSTFLANDLSVIYTR